MKLLGASGMALSLGALGFLNFSVPKGKESRLKVDKASAQVAGSWILGQNTSTIAIHASYLHNGFILYIAGSGYHNGHLQGPFEARLLDPTTGFETIVPMSSDLFCHGSVHLANGNLLIAGGTLQYDTAPGNCNGRWHGLKEAYEFDVASGQLLPVQSMVTGRWYPTLIILGDGRVPTFNGYDEYGVQNRLVEIYNDTTKTWSIEYDPGTSAGYCVGQGYSGTCPGAGAPCFGGTAGNGTAPTLSLYPRMHLMPSGRIITAGNYREVRSFDPATGAFALLTTTSTYRSYGTSVLLPLQNTSAEKGEVLVVGGSPTSSAQATDVVEIIDFNSSGTDVPVVRTVQSIQYRRKFFVPVILPDGKVVIFGGSSQGGTNYVYHPEMFDPVSETWSTLPPATVPRTYHTVALLLYDGRVWVAGSTPTSGTWELRTEIFRPGYYTETRPSISGTPVVEGYGGNVTISTPDASEITSVSLLRLMSATHHYEPNQRFLWLPIVNKTTNSVVAEAPLNGNLAPPGYYMIHVLNSSGVPSEAKIIKIPGTGSGGGDTTPPVQVTGLMVTPAGAGQLNLTWNANPDLDIDHYDVHRSTVSGFTPSSANRIAQPTGTSYPDTGLNSSTTYYYVVAAVDTATNIGPASSEVSGTTEATGGVTFYDVAYPGNAVGGIYSGASVRYGEEARIASSAIVGQSLRRLTVYLRKAGTPSGQVTAVVRRASDDAVVATFNESLNSQNLPTSYAPFDFTLSSPYIIQTGDRILVEYGGPSRVDISVWTTDHFDGDATRRTRYTGTAYNVSNTNDIVGQMSSE
jgi:hypothetical protein